MTRVLLGALVLGLCAWRTTDRAQDWRSDEALWASAVVSAPALPRPALNLAVAVGRLGRWEESVAWTVRADALMRDPRRRWMQPYLCRHLERLAVFVDTLPAFSVECAS